MNGEIDMTELRALLGRMGEMPSERHLQVLFIQYFVLKA